MLSASLPRAAHEPIQRVIFETTAPAHRPRQATRQCLRRRPPRVVSQSTTGSLPRHAQDITCQNRRHTQCPAADCRAVHSRVAFALQRSVRRDQSERIGIVSIARHHIVAVRDEYSLPLRVVSDALDEHLSIEFHDFQRSRAVVGWSERPAYSADIARAPIRVTRFRASYLSEVSYAPSSSGGLSPVHGETARSTGSGIERAINGASRIQSGALEEIALKSYSHRRALRLIDLAYGPPELIRSARCGPLVHRLTRISRVHHRTPVRASHCRRSGIRAHVRSARWRMS